MRISLNSQDEIKSLMFVKATALKNKESFSVSLSLSQIR